MNFENKHSHVIELIELYFNPKINIWDPIFLQAYYFNTKSVPNSPAPKVSTHDFFYAFGGNLWMKKSWKWNWNLVGLLWHSKYFLFYISIGVCVFPFIHVTNSSCSFIWHLLLSNWKQYRYICKCNYKILTLEFSKILNVLWILIYKPIMTTISVRWLEHVHKQQYDLHRVIWLKFKPYITWKSIWIDTYACDIMFSKRANKNVIDFHWLTTIIGPCGGIYLIPHLTMFNISCL